MPVLKNGELYLYGFVGDSYWDEGFTASEVIDALIEVGRDSDVIVHINSGGGYTDDGIAIYNALVAHKGKVTILIDAMAASIASLIAMAGDERVMLAGSLMMIHDPSGFTFGTAADHDVKKTHLNKTADLMAGIYADVVGEDFLEMRKDMEKTLWLDPSDAVERGFATSSNDVNSKIVAAFDYNVYAHAPERLVALSQKNSWSLEANMKRKTGASATVVNGQKGDCKLSKFKSADKDTAKNTPAKASVENKDKEDVVTKAVAADRQRRSEILALDEAKGREKLAENLFASDMSVEDVKAALSSAPKGVEQEENNIAKYEAGRVEANGLALPSSESQNSKAKINRKDIYAARAELMKGDQ